MEVPQRPFEEKYRERDLHSYRSLHSGDSAVSLDVTGLFILFGVFFKAQCYHSNGITCSVPEICVLVKTVTDTRATKTIKGLEQLVCREAARIAWLSHKTRVLSVTLSEDTEEKTQPDFSKVH